MSDDFHSLKAKRDSSPTMAGIGQGYPTLRLTGPQAAECGADECEHGEEYEMTIRVRCKSIGQDYGNEKKPSVTFDILSCTDCEESDDESEEDETEETPEKEAQEVKPKSKAGHLSGRTIIVGL